MFKSTTLSKFIPTKRATLASSVLSACFVYSSTVQAQSNLENPVALKVESGISVISGWHCDADEIEVFIDGQSIGLAGTGTQRPDTQERCGHQDSGFSLLFNYGALSEGRHSISVYADGELFAQRIFNTLRPAGALTDFTSSLSAVSYVYDFPKAGDIVELEWETAKQSFTARRSFRNALDEGFTVVRFNRSFLGHGRGLKQADILVAERDPSEFIFDINRQSFQLTRHSESFGQCEYSGNITFSFSGLLSEGQYSCEHEQGKYTASFGMSNDDGFFSGRFSLTPNGSQESYKDVVIGIAE